MAKRAVSLLLVGKDYPVHGRVYRKFLDMKVVYVYRNDDTTDWLPVTEAVMAEWGATEVDLYNEGIQYRLTCEQPKIKTLWDLALELNGLAGIPQPPWYPTQYVLFNGIYGGFGAALILVPGVIETLEEHFGEELYFIPSSVHEWILAPKEEADMCGLNEEGFNEIIPQANAKSVRDEEVLSDHMYTSDELKTALKKFEKAS